MRVDLITKNQKRILGFSRCHLVIWAIVFVLLRFFFIWNVFLHEQAGQDVLLGDERAYFETALFIEKNGLAGYFDIPKDAISSFWNKPPYWRQPIFRDPLQSLYVLFTYKLAGASLFGTRVSNVILQLLSALICIGLLRKIAPFQSRSTYLLAWIFALYPNFILHSTTLFTENLEIFLFSMMSLFFVQISTSKKIFFYLSFGLVTGLFLLIKSYWIYLIPPLAFSIFYYLIKETKNWRIPTLNTAMYLLAIALVVTPTLIRNYRYSDGGIMISSKAGFNLWKSNNAFNSEEDFYGLPIKCIYEAYHLNKWDQNVRPPCEVPLKEYAQCEQKQAVRFMYENFEVWVSRAYQKNILSWSPGLHIVNEERSALLWGGSQIVRYLLSIINIVFFVGIFLFFFLSLLSPSSSAPKSRLKLYILISLLFLVPIVSFSIPMTRHSLCYIPIVILMACSFRAKEFSLMKKKKLQLALLLSYLSWIAMALFLTLPMALDISYRSEKKVDFTYCKQGLPKSVLDIKPPRF